MYNQRMVRNNRMAGGFFAPFILGGITGGLLAPAFYNKPYPVYPTYPYQPYQPYPPVYY